MTREELVAELEKIGFKWGYCHGHGDSEPCSNGDFVIADIEKEMVLIPPETLFKEPVNSSDWW